MLFDGHIHTCHSHDSESEMRAMCQAAMSAGLAGIAITDHCDMQWELDAETPILASVAEAGTMAEEYRGRLRVFRGVEIGEGLWAPQRAARLMNMTTYDVVIGSVHAVHYEGFTVPFSWINFKQLSDRQIARYLQTYFDDTLALVQQGGFDVLGHLTCALRYITGKYGRTVDMTQYADTIDAILHMLIAQSIALEVNTSSPSFLPDETILQRYYELGGRRITLGSDAHVPTDVGRRLDSAAALLRGLGFQQAYYYDRRRAIAYDL